MKIAHNLLAINVDNFLEISIKKKGVAIEKLSSGYRINRAADDAAGLSISEKMRAQIRGLNQNSRNAQDGISLIQTAEGALNEVHEMLQRMNKLSVQAANGSYSTEDRKIIQEEIDQLVNEVDGISNKTEFNGMKLLDGSVSEKTSNSTNTPLAEVNKNGNMKLQDILNNDSGNLNIIFMDGDNFETTKSSSGTATVAGYAYLKSILQTQIVPQAVTSVLKALAPAFNYLSSSSIGIGLELYSDTNSTTLASVAVGFSTSGGKVNSSMLSYKLSVNMASLNYNSSNELEAESRSALETTIVHEMVHGIMDESLTNGMLGITNGVYDEKSANSYPSWFKEGMAQTAAGGYANCNDWINGGLGIDTSTSQADIVAIIKNSSNSLSSGTTSSKYGTGYLACMYLGYLAGGSSNVTAENISNGLGKILSDLGSGKSLETAISERTNGKYTGLPDFESRFGDTDSSSFIYKLTQVVGSAGNGGLANGNLTDSDILPDIAATTSLFSLDIKNDTITNIYPSGVNVLSGGGATTGGTAPVNDYGTTISGTGGGTGPVISPGSTIDLSNISSISGINYDSVNKVLTITDSGDYTLKGINTTGVRVVVNSGVTANITLNNSKINTADGSGISLEGNANVTLNLVGTNSVISSAAGAAGIRVTTGATLTVLDGGKITNNCTFINDGRIENHGVIGSVSGPGITHHYVNAISKHIKEPTTATIGKSLAESISQFSPSTITVAYNGTTRTLTGTWSVKDKDGNSISDLSGTIVGDNENFSYTVTFASEDGIYFDPLNMSIYSMERTNAEASKSEIVSDEYVSASGPSGGGTTLSYSYVVESAPALAVPDPVVTDGNEMGGIKIQVGNKANQTITITIESVKSDDLSIKDLSVLTHDDAQKAIDSCYKAINKVSKIRGTLGAYQNRLEHAMSSINNTEENLQNAESRIRDMNMAKGMMEYSKCEILIQVAQAMLSQANQEPKSVLTLLA